MEKIKRFVMGKKMWLQLVSLVLLFAFLIAAVFAFAKRNSSLGWFSKNRIVTGSGMQNSATAYDANAAYISYTYDEFSEGLIINDGSSSDPNFINVSGDQGFLKIMPYDMIFRERNKYSPAIIKITLTNIREELASKASGTLNVTLERGASGLVNSGLGEYVSSSMRFTLLKESDHNAVLSAIANKELAADNASVPAIFEAIHNYTKSAPSGSQVFTTYTGTSAPYTYSERDTITVSVPYTSGDIVNNSIVLYLYVSYDSTLVGQKVLGGITAGSSVLGNVIEIENNISKMTVGFGN